MRFDHNKAENEKNQESDFSISRRGFIGGAGGVAALGLLGVPALGLVSSEAEAEIIDPLAAKQRRNQAYKIRKQAAKAQLKASVSSQPTNSDEMLYAGKIANYSKGLPHNNLGEVDINAYNALTNALASGEAADYESIPLGGTTKLANPQAAQTYALEGRDSHAFVIPAFTAFDSEQLAGEMAEDYWHALARDIPFSQYGLESITASAITDLSAFTDYSGVNASKLFRGTTPGEDNGPLVSQFLWKDIPYGPSTIVQRYKSPLAGDVHMTQYAHWLNIQKGGAPATAIAFDSTERYIRNARDLGEWVHKDFSYQGFLNAALILMGMGAARDPHPYSSSATQGAFITFGGPHILEMVAKAAYAGLKAAWYQKWQVHRAARPEVFAGRIHNHITGAATYPIHSKILNSAAVAAVYSQYGTYLLPMAAAEGSPTHPAYPAGHATIAGACVTVLKAFFKESHMIANAVEADDDGLALLPYTDSALTVGGELNKLASNISLGRDYLGVHYRQDGINGMLLGEQVAIQLLAESKALFNESGASFTFTDFSGNTVTI